jgi:hypothetical protein
MITLILSPIRTLGSRIFYDRYKFHPHRAVADALCRLEAVLQFIGNAHSHDTVNCVGYGLEATGYFGSWQSFDESVQLPSLSSSGTTVFGRTALSVGGFSLGRFGLVHLFVECSSTDVAVVSNVPLSDPLPTLVDFAVWAHERWAADEEAGLADPFFNVREAGCIFQMAYGWDEPEHNLRESVEHGLPYGAWLGKVRAAAREWLEQTAFPPKWFAGVEVFEP